MKKRIVMLCSIFALLAFAIAGGTMAWFTSTPVPVDNTFTAGTVVININENGFANVTNWNPGQLSDKNVDIGVSSTKKTYVRVKLTPSWTGTTALPLDFVDIYFADTSKWVFADGSQPTSVMHANDPKLTGYIYYKDIVTGPATSLNLIDSVKFLGTSYLTPATNQNDYQGKKFTLNVAAEGVQASYNAYQSVWGLASLPTGVEAWIQPQP